MVDVVLVDDPVISPVSVQDLATEQLEHQMMGLAGHIAAATCTFLTLLGEFDAREAYEAWEANSTARWLNWRCGVGHNAAREQVRVARALRRLPKVHEAFAAGTLSYSKVRAITRVAHVNNEEDLVYLAHWGTAAQIEAVVRRLRQAFPQLADPEVHAGLTQEQIDAALAEKEAEVQTRRSVEMYPNADGDLVLQVTIPAGVDADAFMAKLDAFCDQQPRTDPDEWDGTVPISKRRADALLDMANAADPEVASFSPTTEITVNLALTPTADGFEVDAGLPEGIDAGLGAGFTPSPVISAAGTALSSRLLERLLDDATLRAVVELISDDARFGDSGRTIGESRFDLGRSSRFPNRALRREVERRDGGQCKFPGCERRHRLQAHHIVYWGRGGPTDLANLILLCPQHHGAIHERRWTLTGTGHDPVFARPDTQRVPTSAPQLNGSTAALVEAHRSRGLDIEHDGAGSYWLGDQLDWNFIQVGFNSPCAQPPNLN